MPQRAWNGVYHLGGYSPWIQMLEGVVQGGIGAPKGYQVKQVHLVSAKYSGADIEF